MLHKKWIFLTAFLFSLGFSLRAEVRGVTGISGLVYPKEADQDLHLSKALVQFNGFDPYSAFNNFYEVENRSFNVKELSVALPVYLFFTDFDRENRSSIIPNLQKVFPDLFQFENVNNNLEKELRAPFADRKHINKFISPSRLSLLHVTQAILVDDKYEDIRKVEVNMFWANEGNNKAGPSREALVLKVNLYFDLQFEPEETKEIKTYCQIPSYYSKTKTQSHYSPFILGTARNWAGSIDQLFIVNNSFTSQLALPKSLKVKNLNLGKWNNLSVMKDYNPAFWEKIAFFQTEGERCDCDNRKATSVTFPYALSGVSGSSRTISSERLSNQCLQHRANIHFVDKIDDFNISSDGDLSLFKNGFERQPANSYYEQMAKPECKKRSEVVLRNNHDAIYAFDLSEEPKKEGRQLSRKTCWCEYAEGSGVGEYIEFNLLQESSEILVYNGNQRSAADFEAYGRVRSFQLEKLGDSLSRSLPVSNSELLNVYQLKLSPGRYRITITNTYPGDSHDETCISAIFFNFSYSDPWLEEALKKLQDLN